jgi:hypothetical protein
MALDFKRYNYVPSIRTRAAELKGWEQLRRTALKRTLPIIEITKSRRSKSNPAGAISKTVQDLTEILEESAFVADLTTLNSLKNPEIDLLLDPEDGFKAWVEFVDGSLPSTCIPSVHLTVPLDVYELRRQISALRARHDAIAVRFPTSFKEHANVKQSLVDELGDLSRVVVLIDAGYVAAENSAIEGERVCEVMAEWVDSSPGLVAPLSSSFPSSVLDVGDDDYGKFSLSEVEISERAKGEFGGARVAHGDYATIHPLDFTGTVTNWVPRVDVPLESSLYYHRYRREDGGYEKCARKAFRDTDFAPLECWGCDNIREAAAGKPQGRSPAHWIAVRLNIHVTRQAARLSGK